MKNFSHPAPMVVGLFLSVLVGFTISVPDLNIIGDATDSLVAFNNKEGK